MIKKILCPVDFSDHSRTAAQYAADLAKSLKAEIIALYVSPSADEYTEFVAAPQLLNPFLEKVATEAQDKMSLFIKEEFGGLKVEGRIISGKPAETITSMAADESIGLIVMGTHGRTGLNRLVFGSVAEKVIKSSPVPVLTIRPAEEPAK